LNVFIPVRRGRHSIGGPLPDTGIAVRARRIAGQTMNALADVFGR
jgi:hypothetical protein